MFRASHQSFMTLSEECTWTAILTCALAKFYIKTQQMIALSIPTTDSVAMCSRNCYANHLVKSPYTFYHDSPVMNRSTFANNLKYVLCIRTFCFYIK
jgi:hypothetical protein